MAGLITMSSFSQARFWLMLVVAIPVVIEDLRTRRIPDWACGVLLTAGLAIGGFEGGISGFGSSLLGAIAGFAVFLIFNLAGAMGGGDIKLMSACGSLVGIGALPVAVVLTAIVGAAIAMLAMVAGMVRREKKTAIPYGPAIVAGVLLALLGRTG